MLALSTLLNDIGNEMAEYKQLKDVPAERTPNFRNDMYVVSEALRLMQKSGKPAFTAADVAVLTDYQKHIDNATKFIPLWVKVAVAMALGLGTMVGWKAWRERWPRATPGCNGNGAQPGDDLGADPTRIDPPGGFLIPDRLQAPRPERSGCLVSAPWWHGWHARAPSSAIAFWCIVTPGSWSRCRRGCRAGPKFNCYPSVMPMPSAILPEPARDWLVFSGSPLTNPQPLRQWTPPCGGRSRRPGSRLNHGWPHRLARAGSLESRVRETGPFQAKESISNAPEGLDSCFGPRP